MERITKNKLTAFFEKIIRPGYELNCYYAEDVLTLLQAKDNPEATKLIESSFFSDLLLRSLQQFDTLELSVKSYLIKLCAIAMRSELQFIKILMTGGSELIEKLCVKNECFNVKYMPCVQLACVDTASVLITHSSGISWINGAQLWKKFFELCYTSTVISTKKRIYQFISDYLWTLSEADDEPNLILCLSLLLKPLKTGPYFNNTDAERNSTQTVFETDERSWAEKLKHSLEILVNVLKNEQITIRNNLLVRLLIKHFAIECHLWALTDTTRRDDIILKLSEAIFLICIAVHFSEDIESLELKSGVFFLYLVQLLVRKRMVVSILDFSLSCAINCKKILKFAYKDDPKNTEKKDNLEGHFAATLIVPVLTYTGVPACKDENSQQIFELFINKILDNSTEFTIKALYTFRELITDMDTRIISIQAVRRMFSLKNFLTDFEANILFQCLYYLMKYYVLIDESQNLILSESRIKNNDDKRLLSLTLDCIQMLLKNFKIHWKESYEVTCLYNVMMNILKIKSLVFHPEECDKLITQILDSITLAIRKFLAPDLSLLQETKPGSVMADLGETIKVNLNHTCWEVRESAAQLLLACTEIAFIKYLPFQKMILKDSLIPIAGRLALQDTEFYVQATALKCLAAAVKMEQIWCNTVNEIPDLCTQLIQVLKTNSQGIVRKEAAEILSEVYSHHKISPEVISCLYQVMFYIALEDVHWEVQLSAIEFWKKVIKKSLTYYGMIDGKFPSVTFSKDSRKIVTLNPPEIQRRLRNVLEELASIGCLTVLLNTLDPDNNIDVMDSSLQTSCELIDVLNMYDVSHENCGDMMLLPSASNESCLDLAMDIEIVENNEKPDQDKVIDEILDCCDYELLHNMSEAPVVKDEEKEPDILSVSLPISVTPYDFLYKFKNDDLKQMISDKKHWNSGVKSLGQALDAYMQINDSFAIDLDCH